MLSAVIAYYVRDPIPPSFEARQSARSESASSQAQLSRRNRQLSSVNGDCSKLDQAQDLFANPTAHARPGSLRHRRDDPAYQA